MDKLYNKIMYELEIAINELEIKGDCSIQRIELSPFRFKRVCTKKRF